MKRADGGFADRLTEKSSLEATHAAAVALTTLSSGSTPDFNYLVDFLRATITPSGFASSQPGQAPSLQATVAWLELAVLVNRKQDPEVQTAIAQLKNFLSNQETEDNGVLFFADSQQEGISGVAFNSLCIRLGELIDYNFRTVSNWVAYFKTLQDTKSGCFFESGETNTHSAAATIHAVRALYVLHRLNPAEEVFRGFSLEGFQECFNTGIPESVAAVSEAHRTLALTPFFQRYFEVTPTYYVPSTSSAIDEEEFVVQGTQLVPLLNVRTQLGPHPGLSVIATFTSSSGRTPVELRINPESLFYQATSAYDAQDLGLLRVSFAVRKFLPTVGQISFLINDQKRVGYAIQVSSLAKNLETGLELVAGDQITPQTIFTHTVQLSTAKEPSITSGPFTVNMQVLDSSGVAIASDTLEPDVESTEALTFRYHFTGEGVPPGPVTFEFSVSGEDEETHSRSATSYPYEANLIATNVRLPKSQLNIGNQLTLQFEPTLILNDAPSQLFSDPAHKRRFFLDLKSPSGNVLHSVPSQSGAVGSAKEYGFTFTIPANAHFLGAELTLAIRYRTSAGGDYVLESHQISALSSPPQEHKVQVLSDLVFETIGTAPASTVRYGQSVHWEFSLVDTISGSRLVTNPNQRRSGLYLTVSHDKPTKFTSVRSPVRPNGDSFSASWEVLADSPTGAATLSIQAFNGDEQSVPITGAASQPVSISGSFSVQSSSYTTSSASVGKTSFIVEFSLLSDGQPFAGSRVIASVFKGGNVIANLANLPVGQTPNKGYAVSWTLPREQVSSGTYEVRLFREMEYYVTADQRSASSPADVVASLVPISSITIQYDQADFNLFFPSEFFVVALFGALTYYVASRYPSHSKQ